VIFAARFMPGLRTPVFFTSGTLHLPLRVFLFYDGLAALISVPTIVYATYFFGNHVDRVVRWVKRIQFGVIGTIVVIVAVLMLKAYWGRRKERELEREGAVRDALDKVDRELQE
jgi:membrane protein DedA with SNARE-associated domain